MSVAPGYYAVAGPGQAVRHYRIDQDGSIHLVMGRKRDFWRINPVRSPTAQADVLRAIGRDPAAAQALYAQSARACGVCGRTLVDERSLSAGVCQQHRSRLLERL